jgi:hypothetical protein
MLLDDLAGVTLAKLILGTSHLHSRSLELARILRGFAQSIEYLLHVITPTYSLKRRRDVLWQMSNKG